jgi:hypothetical protein
MEVCIDNKPACWNREAIKAHAKNITRREEVIRKREGVVVNSGAIACCGCKLNPRTGLSCSVDIRPTTVEHPAAVEQMQEPALIRDLTPELGNQTQIEGLRILRRLQAFALNQ